MAEASHTGASQTSGSAPNVNVTVRGYHAPTDVVMLQGQHYELDGSPAGQKLKGLLRQTDDEKRDSLPLEEFEQLKRTREWVDAPTSEDLERGKRFKEWAAVMEEKLAAGQIPADQVPLIKKMLGK